MFLLFVSYKTQFSRKLRSSLLQMVLEGMIYIIYLQVHLNRKVNMHTALCLCFHQYISASRVIYYDYPERIERVGCGIEVANWAFDTQRQCHDNIERSSVRQMSSHHSALWNGISCLVSYPLEVTAGFKHHLLPRMYFDSFSISVHSPCHRFCRGPVEDQQVSIHHGSNSIMGIPGLKVFIDRQQTCRLQTGNLGSIFARG